MVATLVRLLVSHPRFLKQVDVNEASGQLSHVVEVDPDELSKPGRVVIPDGFGIAIGFENWVGVDNPVLQIGFLLLWRVAILLLLSLASSKDGKVSDDLLGVLGLSGTRLTGDLEGQVSDQVLKTVTHQHGLVLGVVHHLGIGAVRGGKEVGWHLHQVG